MRKNEIKINNSGNRDFLCQWWRLKLRQMLEQSSGSSKRKEGCAKRRPLIEKVRFLQLGKARPWVSRQRKTKSAFHRSRHKREAFRRGKKRNNNKGYIKSRKFARRWGGGRRRMQRRTQGFDNPVARCSQPTFSITFFSLYW